MFLIDFSHLVVSFKVAIFQTWIHCNCTAQAETPVTSTRENRVGLATSLGSLTKYKVLGFCRDLLGRGLVIQIVNSYLEVILMIR